MGACLMGGFRGHVEARAYDTTCIETHVQGMRFRLVMIESCLKAWCSEALATIMVNGKACYRRLCHVLAITRTFAKPRSKVWVVLENSQL